jgi:integrase
MSAAEEALVGLASFYGNGASVEFTSVEDAVDRIKDGVDRIIRVEKERAREHRELDALHTELIEALADALHQACWIEKDGAVDSCALSAYATGLRLLGRLGAFKIKHQVGRRVIGHWPKAQVEVSGE